MSTDYLTLADALDGPRLDLSTGFTFPAEPHIAAAVRELHAEKEDLNAKFLVQVWTIREERRMKREARKERDAALARIADADAVLTGMTFTGSNYPMIVEAVYRALHPEAEEGHR